MRRRRVTRNLRLAAVVVLLASAFSPAGRASPAASDKLALRPKVSVAISAARYPAVPRIARERAPGDAGRPLSIRGARRASSAASIAPPAPSVLVEGIKNTSGVAPPDANGDVGPDDYVQTVNHASGSEFAVYEKDGTLRFGPALVSDLWADADDPCASEAKGDPIVQYDQLAGRWIITQFAFKITNSGATKGPYYECIAVTSTSDPLGGGFVYTFEIAEDTFPDFPKFGVWNDAYYMSVHLFDDKSFDYVGQGIIAFDRDAMLAGQVPREIQFFFNPAEFGLLPSDVEGLTPPPPGTPNYLVVLKDDDLGAGSDKIKIFEFHVDWDNPDAAFVSGPASIVLQPFDSALCGGSSFCIRQPDTFQRLDPLAGAPEGFGFPGGLLLSYPLSYRNFGTHESLIFTHAVRAGKKSHAGLAWYEVRDPGGSPVIQQQGTYEANGSRWVGSLGMDRLGNMALGFSLSSRSVFPSMAYAGRLVTDPPGDLTQGETIIVPGVGSQMGANRWGDYTSMMVDPLDDCTFWYTNEYYTKNSALKWHTAIAAFKFPTC